jgi:CDP-diacylglycerol--serine O-phosphatidyltransferase
MEAPFPSFDPEGEAAAPTGQARLRDIPLRAIFPSLLTLLAIALGMTAMRLAAEERFEPAIAALVFAALLDGIDGRVARFLKSTSRFGAQLDSLADFVNFGVAPALVIYFALLDGLGSIGWIAALVFAICVCLRLARFNVMLDMPGRPDWQKGYFVGIPAPAAAMVVMAPVYLLLLGVPDSIPFDVLTLAYVLGVGLLTVSTLPTYSGKEFGSRIPRKAVLPLLLAAIVYVAFLLSHPWQTLIVCVAAYFLAIPFAWKSWRTQDARQRAIDETAAREQEAQGETG